MHTIITTTRILKKKTDNSIVGLGLGMKLMNVEANIG